MFEQTVPAAIGICTDDVFYSIPKYRAIQEEKIPQALTCRKAQEASNYFKGMEMLQTGETIATY